VFLFKELNSLYTNGDIHRLSQITLVHINIQKNIYNSYIYIQVNKISTTTFNLALISSFLVIRTILNALQTRIELLA